MFDSCTTNVGIVQFVSSRIPCSACCSKGSRAYHHVARLQGRNPAKLSVEHLQQFLKMASTQLSLHGGISDRTAHGTISISSDEIRC